MKVCNVCGKQWFNDIKFCPIDGAGLEDANPKYSLDSLIGQILNHTYKIEEKIGEGSVGAVFKAKHLGIGDTVAIKVISPAHTEKSDSLMRFRREAKAARRLSHPNAVTVYDFNITEGGLLFMVMEYVNGITVEKYLQHNSPIRPQRALDILRPVTTVLDIAHSLGVIHRDLKPANLMICKDSSGNEQIKVLDFGTARLVTMEDESAEVLTTMQGQVLGVPIYMSPEQALSEPVTPATDIYTLGIVLYQMLTGTVPFGGQKAYQVMMGHVNEPPVPPSERNAGLPVEFDPVVLKALAKKPEDRYKTATALADELASVISVLVTRDTQAIPKPKVKKSPTLSASKVTTQMKTVTELPQESAGEVLDKTLNDDELSPVKLEVNLISKEKVEVEPLELDLQILPSNELPPVEAKADFNHCVGREKILERLKLEINSSLEHLSQPIFLVGEPGVGKTVLVNHFQKWAESQNIQIWSGSFTEFISGSIDTLFLWKEILGLLPVSIEPDGKSSRLSTAMLREQREEKKWQLFERLFNHIIDDTKRCPHLIILEDLQWADGLSLEFLGYLLRNAELNRLSFIGTVRSEEFNNLEHPFSQWFKSQEKYFYCQVLELTKFDQPTTSLLMETIFQAIGVEQKDIEAIYNITSGNPLYLVELMSLLKDNGKISLKDNVWQVDTLATNDLPQNISQLIKEKLSFCTPELTDLLILSSAIEETISFDLLEVITGKSPAVLKEDLMPAIDLLLLKEDRSSKGTFLKFHHGIIRRAIYQSSSLEEVQKLHASIAAAYNSLRHTRKFRVGAEFAYHNYLAGAWERAFQHGCSVVDRAFQHSMLDEVIQFSRYAEDAASHLGELDKESSDNLAEVKLLRLQSLLKLNRYAEAEKELELMRPLMQTIENEALLALYHLAVVIICNRNGHYSHGVEIGSAGLVLARAVSDEETILQLIYNIAGCHAHISKLEVAITLFENLYKMAKQAGNQSLRCAALCSIGYLNHFSGNWRESRNNLSRARELAQEYKDPYRECLAVIFSAWVSEYEGNSISLHSYYQTGLKIARTYGWTNYEGYLHFIAGRHQAYSLEPDAELGHELLSNSISSMQSCNELTGQVIIAPALALLNARSNPGVETMESLRSIGESLSQWGEKLNYVETLCFLGEVEQKNNCWEDSLKTFEKALDLAQNIPYTDCQWRAFWGIAKYHKHNGYTAIAESFLNQAISIIDLLKAQFDTQEEVESFLENKQSLFSFQKELFN